jgi:hypothetical protein
MKPVFLVSAFSAALLAPAALASSFSGTVNGTDAIYGAGLGGGGSSTAPFMYDFSAASGNVLTFNSITGATNCCSGTPNTGPDGGGGSTNINALNGISGIMMPSTMALVGVFVDTGDLPVSGDIPPATLNYSAGPFPGDPSFSPLLNQAFFIGDGLTGTGSGAVQSFLAPTGANRLLLGFADGFGFSGTPSFYGDNRGSLSVSGAISSPVPLPPAAAALAAGLLALFGFGARRKA